MNDDPGRDMVPVKEVASLLTENVKCEPPDRKDIAPLYDQKFISKWSRDELENKYLHLYEEGIVIKKHARRQEDKIKRLTTKVLRLISDHKRLEQDKNVKKHDIEVQEMIEDLEIRIRDLERQNQVLINKLAVSKQQLAVQMKRPIPGPYRHITSRINTGISKPLLKTTGRGMVRQGAESQPSYLQCDSSHPTEGQVVSQVGSNTLLLRRQIENYECEIQSLRQQLHNRDVEHVEEMAVVKSELNREHRAILQENVSIIRLQKELKNKVSDALMLESRCAELEKQLEACNHAQTRMLKEIEVLSMQLKEEQERNSLKRNEVQTLASTNIIISELKQQVEDLEKDNKLLKRSNDELTESALNYNHSQNNAVRELELKPQVIYLEATLKSLTENNNKLKENFNREKALNVKYETELKDLKGKYHLLKSQHQELQEKLKTAEEVVDSSKPDLKAIANFLHHGKTIQSEEISEYHEEGRSTVHSLNLLLVKEQANHAETINELERTRNILAVQYRLNEDFQKEVDNLTTRLSMLQMEYETRISEQAKILELRAIRIQRLERQMKDIAYGKTGSLNLEAFPNTEEDEAFETYPYLRRGESVLEIHVQKILLDKEGLDALHDDKPSIFATWAFFHFEIQSTPVLNGPVAVFDYTSHYVVEVDDIFLHYINRENATIELHQVFGTDYDTVAAGHICLQQILKSSNGYIQGVIPLIGIRDNEIGIIFGKLEYWIKLNMPIEQSLGQYKECSKALGYLKINHDLASKALTLQNKLTSNLSPDGINELHLKIKGCQGLKPRVGDYSPSVYCCYKFFIKPDHDTPIVKFSSNPEFDDHMVYNLEMDLDLDSYLRTKTLDIYAFDDDDHDESSYLGVAKVPLLSLAYDKPITGIFHLKTDDNSHNGFINLSIRWQSPYIPPPGASIDTSLPRILLDKDIALPDESDEGLAKSLPTPFPRTSKAASSESTSMIDTAKKPPIIPRLLQDRKRSGDALKIEKDGVSTPPAGFESVNQVECHDPEKSNLIPQTGVINKNSNVKNGEIEGESDSEIVCQPVIEISSISRTQTLTIAINHLTFLENAPVLNDDNIQMLFVEYRFLDFPPEELETPFALPKPKPNQQIIYNFIKAFKFDKEANKERYQRLVNLLSSPTKSRIKFTVVSEPPEDSQDLECEEVGYSYLDMKRVFRSEEDIIGEDIDICDATTAITIGYLNVTVEGCLAVKNITATLED